MPLPLGVAEALSEVSFFSFGVSGGVGAGVGSCRSECFASRAAVRSCLEPIKAARARASFAEMGFWARPASGAFRAVGAAAPGRRPDGPARPALALVLRPPWLS